MKWIDHHWKRYFSDRNEGMGTTYERFILNDSFKKLRGRYAITDVLEAPCFGMTGISGINSLWWALAGCRVSLVDHDEERVECIRRIWGEYAARPEVIYSANYGSLPFSDHSFDLSWNFSALEYLPDMKGFLAELARVTRKVILLCTSNSESLFRLFSKASAQAERRRSSLNLEQVMNTLNWGLIEQGYLDVPPWPDIAMRKEDMLGKAGLKRLAQGLQNRSQGGLCILDYYGGKDPMMESRMLRFDLLEGLPDGIKKLWAHHRYLLFSPM